MSTVVATKTKKRKHGGAASEEATAGVISSPRGSGEPSTKRSKTESKKKEKHEKKKDKGKSKAASSTEQQHIAGGGEFKVISATLEISIPPVFAGNLHAGAEEMLDSMAMRYIPALQGVVIAHDNLRFLSSTATIKADCPFANTRVSFDATVWSPHIGQKLVGKINLCSPDHISILVHRTFNVSIPRKHIPTESWEFEYGPAENDPEFGAGGESDSEEGVKEQEDVNEDGANGDGEDITESAKTEEEKMEARGRWVHKVAGTKLGGEDRNIEFTVIGLTVANQMLSLLGSIRTDPFSEEYWPKATTPEEPQEDVTNHAQQSITQELEDLEMGAEDFEDSEDENGFELLRRNAQESVRRDAERKRIEEEEPIQKEKAKTAKKRKRKSAAGEVIAEKGEREQKRKKS
ncbi:DNA-directed RNA polymerase subunit [Abortiporus biennis]